MHHNTNTLDALLGATKQKNICMIVDSLVGGGTERVVINTAEALIRYSHKISIILSKNIIDYDINKNIDIYLLEKENPKCLSLLIKRIEKLQNTEFDYIYAHGKVKHVKRAKLPNVYYLFHNPISKRFSNRGYLRQLITKKKLQQRYKNEKIIAVSEGVKRDALKYNFKPKSIQTIYNPFNFEKIREDSLLADSDIPKQDYIINVARFDSLQKRHDVLLQAFAESNLDCKLVLLGKGNQKETKKITQLITTLQLENKVIIINFKKNPYPLIKNAKLFALSSDFEGLGNVLIEALILGTPVISTDCESGPEEIMTDDLAQYLTPVGDICSLSNSMKKAFLCPPKINQIDLERFKDTTIIKQYLAPEK
jgi:glycosyltransferase involved in cell wall biosynthesis